MHEGLLAYLHHVNEWPPLFATMEEMEIETAEVYSYCLTTETAWREMQAKKITADAAENNLLAIAQATTSALWAEMAQ